MSAWKRLKLVIEVVEVRLRFVAILVATGLLIGYWDTIKNYWDKWTRPAPAAASALPADEEFFCPMHPQVVRSGLDPNGEVPHCPICGMPLSLRKKGQVPPLPPGVTGRVQLSPERIRLAGIQTAEVQYQPLSKQTITVGNVAYDESRLSRIVSRVNGYVEKLYVNKTFDKVRQGEPLAEIYSPELFSTAQELLLAEKRGGSDSLADHARRRLELLGVAPEDIDAMVRSGQAVPRLVLRSPRSGYVIGKEIVAGARVAEGMTLLEIADLSTVWIEAEVYEKDLSLVRVGQEIEATMESLPQRVFNGRVSLVYPRLDTATRTGRVRFEVDNSSGELRPGMYATVRIETPLEEIEPFKSLAAEARRAEKASSVQPISAAVYSAARGQVLAVPEAAVVDTGTQQIVYAQREPGLFEGVKVELGPRTGGYYPVVKGLEAGQAVAAAGAFLIDAETRLNPGAASTYFGATGASPAGSGQEALRGSEGDSPIFVERKSGQSPEPVAPSQQPQVPSPEALQNLAKLPAADQTLAAAQKVCPITGLALGAMGVPLKIMLEGQPVLLCCPGCVAAANKEPKKVLKKVAQLKAASD